jgi:hypothetical protein
MRFPAKHREQRWLRKFAWWPVRIPNETMSDSYFHWVWLEWIEVRDGSDENHYAYAGTLYRAATKKEGPHT